LRGDLAIPLARRSLWRRLPRLLPAALRPGRGSFGLLGRCLCLLGLCLLGLR
jgi:hypothetical protein